MKLSLVLFSLLFSFVSHAQTPKLQFDSSVTSDLRAQINGDLSFISTLQLSKATPLHAKIFGKNLGGNSYGKWFGDRVDQVGTCLCGDDNAVACVLPAWDNKLWLSPNYTKFSQPQVARISVLFHEARHTEADQGNWPHSPCPKNFVDANGNPIVSIWTGASLAGEYACDVEYNGSYGTQTILLKNIAMNCKNCTDKVKADAELFGDDQLNRIIDTEDKTLMEQDFGMSPPKN